MVSSLSHNKLTLTNTFLKLCLFLFLRRQFLTRTSCFTTELKRRTEKPLDQVQEDVPGVSYWRN